MGRMTEAARDFEAVTVDSGGDDRVVDWFPAGPAPDGKPHGAAGICVSDNDELVLISTDEVYWGFPAGRPEGDETLRETLDREMREEACVTVRTARLLGYARSLCLAG